MNATIEERRFLCRACRCCITITVGAVELCTGGCEGRTSTCVAEECSLLDAVARERLVKREQAGKSLAGAVVNCEDYRRRCNYS
jgi:hypothetical protein